MAQGRGEYTGFGKKLRTLMVDRGIPSWMALSRRIEEKTGEGYSHQRISNYAYGKGDVQIPTEFVRDVAEALELSDKERTDLAEQYTFHSRPPTTRAALMA